MRIGLICTTAALAVTSWSGATGYAEGDLYDENAAHNTSITISINPEARVSVTRTGNQPSRGTCGVAIKIAVRIVNEAYLTAPLQASLVDSVPQGVNVEFPSEPLKGMAEENRILLLTLKNPGLTDLTISFHAKNEAPDLGGRDRIHLLAQCKR